MPKVIRKTVAKTPSPPQEPTREQLAHEGRRLALAYHHALETWLACRDVAGALSSDVPETVRDKGGFISDSLCSLACDAQDQMIRFVLRVTKRTALSGKSTDYSQAQLESWNPAVVLLDGWAWVVSQDANAEPGDLVLTPVFMGHAVSLDRAPAVLPSSKAEGMLVMYANALHLTVADVIRRAGMPVDSDEGPPTRRRTRNPFAAPGRDAEHEALLFAWRASGLDLVEASERLLTKNENGATEGGVL